MDELIYEAREEFQIPPYFPDSGLLNYLNEGKVRLEFLNPLAKEDDKTYRMLLKNYIYYAYHHKVHEFEDNYGSLILTWQMGAKR